MTKLDMLIQSLCPNGVKFTSLINVADILYGYPCDASKFNEGKNGLPLVRIRDVLAGKTTTYTTEEVPQDYIVSTGDLLVGMDGNFHVSTWKMPDSILCQRVCRIRSKDEAVTCSGFLNHLLPPIIKDIEQNKQSGTVKHLLAKDINLIKIPLPPLPVQQEIVRILDNFTELTAELTAELAARRKQYEHYRDELLTTPADSTMMALGAIADYRRGSFPQPYGNSEWYGGVGAMPFVQVADVEENGMVLREQTKQQISVVAQPKSVYVPAGTVICSIQGSIGRVAITQYDAYVDRTLAIFEKYKTDINKRYFAYQIQRKFGIEKEFARGSTLKTITKEEFTKFEIPVPPITEQERIVSVLDRFDTLCNDLTSGLPAEIAARQKQYEYYRDKLLTFKEA